jgi:hypothetical protein
MRNEARRTVDLLIATPDRQLDNLGKNFEDLEGRNEDFDLSSTAPNVTQTAGLASLSKDCVLVPVFSWEGMQGRAYAIRILREKMAKPKLPIRGQKVNLLPFLDFRLFEKNCGHNGPVIRSELAGTHRKCEGMQTSTRLSDNTGRPVRKQRKYSQQ